jgi:hypothetical protein
MFLQRANAELDQKGRDAASLLEARRVFGLMDSVLDIQPRALRVVVGPDRVDPALETLSGMALAEVAQMEWAVARLQDRLAARAAPNCDLGCDRAESGADSW